MKERIRKATVFLQMMCMMLMTAIFLMMPQHVCAEGEQLRVEFLDVGQGNAVLLESQGHYVLIDGGDRETSSFVVSYLHKNKGLTHLTMLWLLILIRIIWQD